MKYSNRWLPDFNGFSDTLSSMKFNWRRYMTNEYNTVYLLLVSILLVLITHHPILLGSGFNEKMTIFVPGFLLVSIVYLIVRWLKKSKRLNQVSKT